MTNATLEVYDGGVSLKVNGNPVVVEILYKGRFEGKSVLPNGFVFIGNKGRILILRTVDQQFPELLFTYKGEFSPIKSSLYEKDLRITAKINVPNYKWQYQSKSENTWNLETSTWQSYRNNFNQEVEPIQRKVDGGFADIVTNNIKSVSGNLVTKDGEPYYGDVHFHSGGYFMTGGVHNEDSVRLYRKNGIRITRRR